ncbi:unnamed protein product [Lymnaea stagnalis]|uniref:Uncharacterized protein n=2 Tax=Lymnaea stagnalis TaxID=6523 RepID=A0AAV2IP66_LYMST
MKMSGLLSKPDYGVVGIVFTVVFCCWCSSSTTHALSIAEPGRDRYDKRSPTGHGVEVVEVAQSGEDYGSNRPQPVYGDEDEEDSADVYVGSDESSSGEKTRLTAAKRRLRFNKRRLRDSKRRLRFHKRRVDSADESNDDGFDRKAREPRLRFHDVRKRSATAEEGSENAEIEESHLGNSRSRRSAGSAPSSANEVQHFKRRSITNDLRAIADSYLYDQHKLREQQEENLRRRFYELSLRPYPDNL